MKTSKHAELEKQIEQLVQSYLQETRKVAIDAVARAFAVGNGKMCPKHEQPPKVRSGSTARRTPEELENLSSRLYEAVCRHPGETMTQLAPKVGVGILDLKVPTARLRRAGQIRTIGQRQFTKYFPLTASGSA